MMSGVNRSLRTVSRSLRVQPTSFQRATPLVRSARFGAPRSLIASTTTFNSSRVNSFSTTATRKSAAAMPQEGREYDPEIKDIAEYVTKPIDSELAVSLTKLCLPSKIFTPRSFGAPRLTVISFFITVSHCAMGFPRYSRLWS